MELTKRQAEILDFLKQNPRASIREIADEFRIRSTNGVVCHLEALEKKGCITRDPYSRSRSIVVRGAVTDEQVASLRRMKHFHGKEIQLGDGVYRLTRVKGSQC